MVLQEMLLFMVTITSKQNEATFVHGQEVNPIIKVYDPEPDKVTCTCASKTQHLLTQQSSH